MIKKLLNEQGINANISKINENSFIYKQLASLIGTEYKILELAKVIEKDEDASHLIICITGGNNGQASWINYFNNLNLVFQNLTKSYNAWLVRLDNDCLDDVHYVYIGLNNK